MTRDQIAQEAAEHIVNDLNPEHERFHAHPDVTIHYLDDTRPPTDVAGVKAALLDGRYWISWMDDHLTAALKALAAASA